MRRLSLLLPLALLACATTGRGGSIAIETVSHGQSVPGANCTVSTNTGTWNVITPASIMVSNGSGDLRVVCNKNGYRTSEMFFRSSPGYSGSSIGVGAAGGGGNVGVGVGLSVPVSGGGGYPSRVTVDMNPS